MNLNSGISSWIDSLDVEEDANLSLNHEWSEAFLAFMEMSHLPAERLLVYAQAVLAAYPPALDAGGIRYPLTAEAIKRWLTKMYDAAMRAYRAQCQEELDDPETLAFCLAATSIESASGNRFTPSGTLIIAFERRSETLLHHIVRQELTATEMLFVVEKLAGEAIRRLGPKYKETWRHLMLPWPGKDQAWSRDIYWLFEKNLPVSKRTNTDDAKTMTPRFLEKMTVDDHARLLRCRTQGRSFETRYDLWSPMYYGVRYQFPTVTSDEGDSDDLLHDILATAAVKVRSMFRKNATTSADGTLVPTWEVESRARRKLKAP